MTSPKDGSPRRTGYTTVSDPLGREMALAGFPVDLPLPDRVAVAGELTARGWAGWRIAVVLCCDVRSVVRYRQRYLASVSRVAP